MADGNITFLIDVYHKDYGRFVQSTGIKENPKNRKAYNQAKAEILDKVRIIEKDLQFDAAAVFERRAKAAEDFVEFLRSSTQKMNYSAEVNAMKKVVAFSGGVVPFEKLNAAWLEQFKNHLLKDEISQNTAKLYFGIVRGSIRQAWRQGYIHEDFTGKVASIKPTDIKRHFLTLEEIETLSKAFCEDEMVKNAFLFACFTGLRVSDIELLQWGKVSFVDGAPFIEYQQKKTKQYENCPIPEQAVKILMDVKKIHPLFAPDGDERVFIMPCRAVLGQILHVWGRRAGLSWQLHFHSSRHTMATLMLTAGSDIYTVSKQLGHKDIATTQKYSRLIDSKRVAEVNRLPVFSRISEPQAIAISPLSTASSAEGILPPEPATESKTGSIADALQAKGEKIARSLSLIKNSQGKYEFNGREYSAIELAMEV